MLRFLSSLLAAEMMLFVSTTARITFSTVTPSIWTKTYVSVVTEIEPNSTTGGELFIMSTKNAPVDVWLNAVKQTRVVTIDPGETSTLSLSKKSLLESGSARMLSAFSLISQESLGVLFRDKWTFFQLREMYQLSKNYMVVTYHQHPTEWVSVICICGFFDLTTVTLTFKDGINVTEVLEGVSGISSDGQRAVVKKLSYREVFKIESLVDLSGTQIKSNQVISVLAGSVSYEEENRSAFLDHAIGTDDTNTEYIVWGLLNMTGNDVCRVVAQSANTAISINGNELFTLSSKGDVFDFNIVRKQFILVSATSPVMVTILLNNGGLRSSDMIFAMPIGWKNYSRYTFLIPSLKSDINLQHYVVVTTTLDGRGDLKLNGENLPADTEWIPVPGTDYIGAYIALDITAATQYIDNSNDVPFNAYLLGHGDNVTFGSALIPTSIPQPNTDSLTSTVNALCLRTNQEGNYNSGATKLEIFNLRFKGGFRSTSYKIRHIWMQHAEACQMNCLLYADCIGVNFKWKASEGDAVNCDIIMTGSRCTVRQSNWNFYAIK